MPAAKRRKTEEMSDEEAIRATRAEMIRQSSAVSSKFEQITRKFTEDIDKLILDSDRIVHLGQGLRSRLMDKWRREFEQKSKKAIERLRKAGLEEREIEDRLVEMSDEGEIHYPETLEEKFAGFLDSSENGVQAFNEDNNEVEIDDLSNALAQIQATLDGLTEAIREIPTEYPT